MAKIDAIFLESGHGKNWMGGKDTGATSRFGGQTYYERVFAKEIGSRVLKLLKSKVELQGSLIQGVGIETETDIRAKMKFVNHVISENHFLPAKCFGVAIHMNSGPSTATGFEVWYQKNGRSKALAESVARSWLEYKITPMRAKPVQSSAVGRYGRFYIDDAWCPYIIVETSFISNLKDINALMGDWDRVAECIAHGILEHIRSL